MKKLLMAIAIGAVAVQGCVSLEGTRAQLSSNNPQEVKNAEDTIYKIATTGKDKTGLVQFTTQQQVEYIQLTSNQELLLRIIDNAYDGDVIAAAVKQIDFKCVGVAKNFVARRFNKLDRIITRKINDYGNRYDSYDEQNVLKKEILQYLTEADILELWSAPEKVSLGEEMDIWLEKHLVEITDSPTTLWRLFNGDIHTRIMRGNDVVEQRLLSMLDKVSDEQMIEKILEYRSFYGKIGFLVKDADKRILLMSKLPESRMVELAMKDIDDHSVYEWNKNNFTALELGIGITAYIKDSKSVIKLVAAVLAKIAEYRKECKGNWNMSWGDGDEAQVKKLIAGIPQLSDTAMATLVCLNGTTWKYLIDRVTADNAYNILTQGKAKYDDLEVALIKKLPQQKVDMKVFAGVKTDAGKKAVMAAMPDDVRKSAKESTEKALAVIMGKAKVASTKTFETHGFFLGMAWEDMLIVLAHHFPDYEIKETRDGDGKEADYVVYVANQKTPFCYASAKDKKVYQFNFGKKMLKKWYKYDVQTYMEWSHAYERETKIDMKFKLVEKDTTVYEPDMSRSYRVWFHQESYQYKHNTKEYRLTYFGKEKDFTFEGGIGGAIIKDMAAPRFRYVRGDPGSLRAEIERD